MLVVVEGGTDCIADSRKSLEHKIPVVVCAGVSYLLSLQRVV